jgi:hypothetical protein
MKFSDAFAEFSENKKKPNKNKDNNILFNLEAIGKQFPLHNRKLNTALNCTINIKLRCEKFTPRSVAKICN